MGRVKSELPKASFALQNYPNAKGEQAIYLRYWVQSHYARRSTDIWVKPEDWDPKAQEVKPKNKSAARINNKLKLIRKEVDDQIMSYHEGKINYQVIQKMLDKALHFLYNKLVSCCDLVGFKTILRPGGSVG